MKTLQALTTAAAILGSTIFCGKAICSEAKSHDLRGFSLSSSIQALRDTPSMQELGCTLQSKHGRDRIYFLRRLGSENLVAVLKIRSTSRPELNPPGIDYGPIPPLNKLSVRDADELWSDSIVPSKVSTGIRSYHLRTQDGDCQLNLRFKGGRLLAYGIETQIHGIANIWQNVSEESE